MPGFSQSQPTGSRAIPPPEPARPQGATLPTQVFKRSLAVPHTNLAATASATTNPTVATVVASPPAHVKESTLCAAPSEPQHPPIPAYALLHIQVCNNTGVVIAPTEDVLPVVVNSPSLICFALFYPGLLLCKSRDGAGSRLS